jgi:hypothetical protein
MATPSRTEFVAIVEAERADVLAVLTASRSGVATRP